MINASVFIEELNSEGFNIKNYKFDLQNELYILGALESDLEDLIEINLNVSDNPFRKFIDCFNYKEDEIVLSILDDINLALDSDIKEFWGENPISFLDCSTFSYTKKRSLDKVEYVYTYLVDNKLYKITLKVLYWFCRGFLFFLVNKLKIC